MAQKRGTAVDLQKKVLPLFPEAVSKICSLVPGKNRLTISVLLDIDTTGSIVEFAIKPTIISVDHQFTYQEVQSLIGETDKVPKKLLSVKDILKDVFFNLSPLVKARRLQRGGLEITTPKVPNLFQDEGRLGVILVDSTLPVRSLLTELTILAGKVVAEHLQALEVPGIYCTQLEPDIEELEDLLKLGNNLGLQLDLDTEGEITSQDYQRLTEQFAKSPEVMVLNYLLQNTFKPIKYTAKPGKHFGLAYTDGYTHCLSPGQRYIDLLIQRILKAVFETWKRSPSQSS